MVLFYSMTRRHYTIIYTTQTNSYLIWLAKTVDELEVSLPSVTTNHFNRFKQSVLLMGHRQTMQTRSDAKNVTFDQRLRCLLHDFPLKIE